MRTSWKIVMLVSLALAFSACKKKGEEKKDEGKDKDAMEAMDMGAMDMDAMDMVSDKLGMAVDKLGMAVDKVDKALKDDRPPLTMEQYEKYILALSACKLQEWGVDNKCEQHKTLQEARSAKGALTQLFGKYQEIGLKHMKHENDTVRYYAIGLLGTGMWNTQKEEVATAVIAASENEKNHLVLRQMIQVLATSARKHPSIAKWLVEKMSKHENENVRSSAAGYLASANRGIEGFLARMIEMIQKDPSDKVKQMACKRAYEHWDDKILPIYQKLTANDKDPGLYSSCLEGLFNMWNAFVFLEKPSEKAFKLTLQRMYDKPRTKNRPPWTIMRGFGRIPMEKVENSNEKRIPAWYKEPLVIKAMLDVARDPAANWMSRTGAVSALAELGLAAEKEKRAGVKENIKKEIDKLQKELEGRGEKDRDGSFHVVNTIKREAAKL
ncbi:MAG: HEAT repeat domain-containing protein [Polyangia bacterium]|jgi:hypothetical protein|nr:HEAT repeat domain-containing protein [Polyangia bacterium]